LQNLPWRDVGFYGKPLKRANANKITV